MKRKPLNLKLGEVICDKCHGKGGWCEKCHGDGKLDWVENIVGKKPGLPFDSILINELASKLAKEIDEEIIKEILKKETKGGEERTRSLGNYM